MEIDNSLSAQIDLPRPMDIDPSMSSKANSTEIATANLSKNTNPLLALANLLVAHRTYSKDGQNLPAAPKTHDAATANFAALNDLGNQA